MVFGRLAQWAMLLVGLLIAVTIPICQALFHDQTEETDGDRGRQREGWPAGQRPAPAPLTMAMALRERGRDRAEPEKQSYEAGDLAGGGATAAQPQMTGTVNLRK